MSGGLFALNRVQARRQCSVIKSVAEKAEAAIDGDNERRSDAIALYTKYLKFQPQDEGASVKYCQLLLDQYRAEANLRTANSAVNGLELFLRRFPDHAAERRQLANLYIKIGKTRNAREHIDVLFNSTKGDFKQDVELLEMASICEQVSGESAVAIKYLEEAIGTEKAPVRVYQEILQLLNSTKVDPLRESKIANHIRTLLEKDNFRNNLEARIAVARFELFRHEFENAHRDIEYARTKIAGGADNPEVLLAAAEWEIAGIHRNADTKPRLTAARALLEKAFAIDAKNVQVGLFLADVLDKLGERATAIKVLQETAKAFGPINDQFWVLIDYLIDLKNTDLSTNLVERASASGKDDARLNYFRGRLALTNGDLMKARSLLEEAAPSLIKLPTHHKRAMAGLGSIYEQLQNPDQQLNCYRSALQDDGSFLQALIGEATALAKLGRLDEAITRYQALVTAYQISELRPTLARLRLLDIIRKPSENRNWAKFDSEDTFGPPGERTSELLILYAQGLAIRGEKDKAIEVLKEVLKKDKDEAAKAAAWVALARIQEAGKPEAAMGVLVEAEKSVGYTVDLRLARADVLIFRAKPPTVAEFEALGQDAQKFLKADQYRLWFGLGQAVLQASYRLPEAGDERKLFQLAAVRFLRLAGEADPRDLHCRAVLVDLALTTDRKDHLEATIQELANLEGPDGPISTLGRVSIRMAEVRKIQDQATRDGQIRELRELTKKVQEKRRGWGRVYVALGRLDEMEGLTDQALEHYREAINEGDRDEALIRKTVALYREQKQDAMAAGMLDELSTKMVLPEDLERFRAIFEMLNRVVPRSERPTIDRIAPAASLDSRIQLLRGSLLAAIRDEAESLKAFRRAIELASDHPETWESLIRQLVRTGDKTAAKQALAEAERTLRALPQKSDSLQAELFIVLGECHELCGDMKTAGDRYEEAIKIAPKELRPHRQMIQYLLRIGQQDQADKILFKLASDPAQDLARWSRRYLAAYSLMSRPDAYLQRHTALALIKKNLDSSPNDPDDIKAEAVIKTVDPVTREDGVRVLKEYWAKGELTPDESYHLGMLIFGLGPNKILESVKFFESAAKPRLEVTTEHVAGLIRVYAALDKLDSAEATLERLRAVAPNGWETTREEARLLMKKSRLATIKGESDDAKKLADQARNLILKFPGHDAAEMIRLKSGPLLAELGFQVDAEILYRKLITISDSPTAHTPLAILYIQTKKSAEAIKLAREFEAKSPILLTAQILSSAVRVKRPAPSVEKEVEVWLDDKIKNYAGKPEYAGLLAARADLYDAQEKWPEAIAEYRRSLKEGPSDSAVNNLAMLLALYEPKKADEAVRLISALIDVRGPVPTYLDTRAVAYIVQGGNEIDKAVEDLKMARLQHPRALYAYHLAWAYDLQLKRGDKEKLLEEAQRIGIEIDDVHQLEREKFRKLFGPEAK
jgi:tetratricopeptide (TPR) repeat protein